jgi:hypothetical protein
VLFVATIIVRKIGEIHATGYRRFDGYNPQGPNKPQARRNRHALPTLPRHGRSDKPGRSDVCRSCVIAPGSDDPTRYGMPPGMNLATYDTLAWATPGYRSVALEPLE